MNISHARVVHPDSHLLWNWVLARQGVYEGNGLISLGKVADRTLGLHAARIQTPFITAAVRLSDPTQAVELLGTLPQPSLMTIRGVRRTLHVMTPEHASISHGATVYYRMKSVSAMVRRASLDQNRITATSRAIVRHLVQHGAIRERDLEFTLSGCYAANEVRLALKSVWEAGYVAFHNASGSWDASRRTFGVAAAWHPEFARNIPRDRATMQLLVDYLERYGPATINDASWWSALGRGTVREAFNSIPVVRMRLPWATSEFFMTERSWSEFESDIEKHRFVTGGIALLSNEDCALKAYNESRERYLNGRPQKQCFNSIGEVRPVIIKDGHIVGLWQWDRKALAIKCRHFLGATTRHDQTTTIQLAHDLTILLRRHLSV